MSAVKLILREDIPRLGDAGDVVAVKPGYARNYLLPRGLATIATEARVNEVEHHRRIIAEKRSKELKDFQGLAKRLGKLDLAITVQAGESGKLFGSVTAQQIADLIAEHGYPVDRRKLVLHEPIKQIGEYEIDVRLRSDVDAKVKLSVTSSTPVVVKDDDDEGEEEVKYGSAGEDDDRRGRNDDDD